MTNKMNLKKLIKPERKSKITTIRMTKSNCALLKKKKISPSRLFDEAMDELRKDLTTGRVD